MIMISMIMIIMIMNYIYAQAMPYKTVAIVVFVCMHVLLEVPCSERAFLQVTIFHTAPFRSSIHHCLCCIFSPVLPGTIYEEYQVNVSSGFSLIIPFKLLQWLHK